MKLGRWFLGYLDYGTAWGIILRLPRWAWKRYGKRRQG